MMLNFLGSSSSPCIAALSPSPALASPAASSIPTSLDFRALTFADLLIGRRSFTIDGAFLDAERKAHSVHPCFLGRPLCLPWKINSHHGFHEHQTNGYTRT